MRGGVILEKGSQRIILGNVILSTYCVANTVPRMLHSFTFTCI